MEQYIFLLGFLIIGIIVGALFTLLVFRNTIETTRIETKTESQIEIARLNQRLLSIHEEKTHCQYLISKQEEQINTLHEQNNQLVIQRAQLEERASRVVALEQQIEQLQIKLQDETNKNASLTEQIVYLPELRKKLNELQTEQNQFNQTIADYRQKIGATETTVNYQIKQIKRLEEEKNNLIINENKLIQNRQELTTNIAELTTQLEMERTQIDKKINLITEAKTQLSDQFKSLASDILEEKSKRFTEQNKTNIEQILDPLKNKINEFQGKVEEVYVQEGKDRSILAEQVKQLTKLNNQLSQDALNLTTALKGQSKTQGDWGEFILDRILENSGLIKDEHYLTQASYNREDGTRAQPDVVINLPEGRHLIIDSKVSIVAYNDYVNSDNDTIKDAALKRHIESIRNHIKNLSGKNYQKLYELKTLDFVVMFVAIEPAYILAISHDSDLWQEAWTKNVLLVSPSTLLFVVRVVSHLWKQEQQTKNTQEIAARGALLYNKLVSFVEDFEKIGTNLTKAQEFYTTAYKKFTTGNGNIIRQAQKLEELGIKPTKPFPSTIRYLDSND